MQFIVKYGFFCLSGFFASFLVHLGGQKNPISTVSAAARGGEILCRAEAIGLEVGESKQLKRQYDVYPDLTPEQNICTKNLHNR